ncbi:MAG: substrate-binding domain-containing protein, partial [Alphaproteobacteria bacterium]|nr:substrate-binding domain-containing protein [Alphaproteobacteria bacterium]
ARSLHNQRSDLVGVIVSDLDNPFRAEQVDYLSKELLKQNLRPILLRADKDLNISEMIGALLSYNVTGVIVTSDTPPREICEECQNLGVPMVLINKEKTDLEIDQVQGDFLAGGKLAFDLLRDGGCKNMLVVAPEKMSYSIKGRADEFIAACNAQNLPIHMLSIGHQDYQGGLAAANLLIEKFNQCDGIFCVADYMALGLLDGLRHTYQISIPQDKQLVGFDNIPQSKWLSYQLSTIHQDTSALAKLTVNRLLSRLENPNQPAQHDICSVQAIRRATTKNPA